MKAVVYEKYGSADVLDLRDVERPAVGAGDVLVKVRATSVTTADWRLRASAFPGATWLPGRLMFGLFRPKKKILGMDFAGVVESIGENVTGFGKGDPVFGFAGNGAHAEFVAVAASGAIVGKPADLGFEEAAAVPFGALSALVFLRDFAKLRRGQKILIVGASGGVGSYAVQIARYFGADVTGVCSTGNLALVRQLGADYVVDYTTEDLSLSDRRYDVIFDTVGATSFARCRSSLTPEGIFVPLNFGLREAFQALRTAVFGGRKVVLGISGDSRDDLSYLADLLQRGDIRPVIDRCYSLEKITEAHRYVEGRHRRGAVVVRIGAGEASAKQAA